MHAPISLLQQLSDLNIPLYPSVTGPHHPVSVKSLVWFFWALVWGGLLLISFTGWGRFAGRVLRVQRLPASVACTVGIAVIIFLGGLLNLLNAIYASVIFSLVAIGLLVYLLLRKERPEKYRWKDFWKKSSTTARLLLIATLLILIFRIAGTVRLAQFDAGDDGPAYLALPQKMLSTHHFAGDPFSERRNTSALGGSYLLQDFILSAASLSNIAMADRTLGLFLLAAATLDLGATFGLSASQIALLAFLIFLVPQPTHNLTFIVLPISLLLSMTWLIFAAQDENTDNRLRYALLAGIIGGATVSLKSTYLPVVATFSTIPYFVSIKPRQFGVGLKLFFSTAAAVLIALALWMLAMKLSSGTYLFPILGHGVDYSGRGLFHAVSRFPTARSRAKVFLQGSALLLLAAFQMVARPRTRLSVFSSSILISAALSIVALNYASSADSIWRYNFPQFFAAIIVFYVEAVATKNQFQQSQSIRFARYAAMAAMLLMIFYYDIAGRVPEPFHEIAQEATSWQGIAAGLSGRSLASPRLETEYRSMEHSIPQNGGAMEALSYPFLLDYHSRKIDIMDLPGTSAPPPGWPFHGDVTEVGQYLLDHSIRYVAVDYPFMRQFDASRCQELQTPDRYSEWFKEQLWVGVLADHQLDELMSRYQTIYNDGSMAVVDLSKPVSEAPNEGAIWTIHSSVDAVCSQVAKLYFENVASL